jgi:hypothetical protein
MKKIHKIIKQWEAGKIPAHEAMHKIKKAQGKLVAICYGDDGFAGDSAFNVPPPEDELIVYKEGMKFVDVKKAWLAHWRAQFGPECTKEDLRLELEMYGEPAGAWIVSKPALDAASLVWESDPGNDSAVYNCNHIAKLTLDDLCIKRLGAMPT